MLFSSITLNPKKTNTVYNQTLTAQADINLSNISRSLSTTVYETPIKQRSFVTSETSPVFKKYLNISDSLSSSISDPLSPIEEKLLTHLNKRKIHQEGKFIRCKTGGQPIFLQIVSKPRKDITDVSAVTKRRKCIELEEHRNQSVGSNNVTSQLSNECTRNDV